MGEPEVSDLGLRETGVRELGPLGSGRHPSHNATPSGPGEGGARGIAGEKFTSSRNGASIHIRWDSSTSPFPQTGLGTFSHLLDPNIPAKAEDAGVGAFKWGRVLGL